VNQNYININVNGSPVAALLDMGVAKTLISRELATKLRVPLKQLTPGEQRLLFTADGSEMYLNTKTTLCIRINELTVYKEAYVIDCLSHSLIVGCDFLRQTAAVVDYGRRTVMFSDCVSELPLFDRTRDCRCEQPAFAVAALTMAIPAYSEAFCKVRLPRRYNGQTVLLEPTPNFQFKPLATARAVVTCKKGQSVCKVLNFSPRPLTLHKNKLVAAVESLDTIASCVPYQETEGAEATNQIEITQSKQVLDEFNSALAFKINPDITPQQKYELLQVLWDNKNAFATSLSDIGVYEHYQMVLEPIDNRKSYRRQFRLPIEDSREIERQITEMHQHGVIEPSENADFKAPVFLVAKKSGAKRLVIDLRGINALIKPPG